PRGPESPLLVRAEQSAAPGPRTARRPRASAAPRRTPAESGGIAASDSAYRVGRRAALSAIVGGRLWMNEHSRNLRMLQSELVFEVGDDGVDTAHRKIVRKRAVTIHLNSVRGAGVPARDRNLMNVEDLGIVSRRFAKPCLQILGSFDWRRMRNRRWFAFDMRQQCGD